MKISQRISKAEQHFQLRHLYARGWRKKENKEIVGGNIVTFKRIVTRRGEKEEQILRIRYMNNGWVSFY